ncbi:MAG: hypothetical protein ACYDAN_02490 [Candidatus Limnocylindrales bacterium]
MTAMLLAYDADGNVVGTLDYVVARDDEGNVTGLVDFAAHEAAGGDMTDVWVVDMGDPAHPVRGSKVWPEWLGGQAHAFRVELEGPPGGKRIAALVHKASGHRRERAALEAAIADRVAKAAGQPADIRDLVGGPDRPLRLDADGRTAPRPKGGGTPSNLPLVGETR